MDAKDLHYGDVIRFTHGGDPVTAMVVLTSTTIDIMRGIKTDEGTLFYDKSDNILVFGLANECKDTPYHPVGGTATVDVAYKSIEVVK